ncbi:TonB-dependent receptor domain-containing protein [Allopontixanthobacter sediminis]|uniref:TonB-dependent receptor n=1 Tax=Allopontixanthobacter sediminis TaxID=1689985 RepID=A0A845B422_9SPHN|nr:TonB-dependent receptor [Allopontixanthobacter sediminis]MXP45130.1 TonB-dependent receptor [Allopontixanthobacter sediminis]
MKNTLTNLNVGKGRLFAGAGLAAVTLATFASPAYAQDADDEAPVTVTEEAPVAGAIVVTGTRIRRDEFTTAEPITVITSEEITQAGFNSATDALQSNAVTQGSGQINNFFGGFVTDGGTGANTLGLRGLGPSRTLILLNGRRLAPGGTRGSVLAADLNVLPTAIVDRIEVLKAGASSVYGSDAVAGVVNIITDQQLRGFQIEAQTNVPEVGAGIDTRVAASFGFQTDRLSIVGSVEYRKRNKLARNDVPFFDCPIGGFLDGEGSEFGSADGVGFDGTGCFTLDNGGVTINTLGAPTRDAVSRTTGAVGRFNRFVPAPGQTTGPFPGYLGVDFYSRDTLDPAQEEEPLITQAEIYTGYLSASYDLGTLGNAELYGELLGTRRNSASPLYRQLSLDYVTGSPLLPTNLRNGVFLAANPTSNGRTVAARGFIGFGLTDSAQQVDYVRAGAGLRGDFFLEGWRYDAYVGKSWNDGTYEIESFLTDRLAASLDVVQNTDGSFSCASQGINPNCVAAPALSADVIGGILPQDFKDYILVNTIGETQFRETTFAFNIDGPIFAMPGGDVQLALGAEYRKQSINDQPDANSINGNLFGLTAGTPTVGNDNVKEVFGEVFVPILADVPFFYRLNLNASARYTDYASYGSDTTYKIGGEWEPIRGFALRGSYGTSYRAPALAEQFLGATSGFLGSGSDPCDDLPAPGAQSPNQQIIAANCASIGLPVGFTQTSGISVFRVGGAEAGLSAETSKNWTVGAVVSPPLPASIGTVSLSLDYFDIKVDNGVSDLAGGTILNRCYSDVNFDPNAGFCRFVTRDANQRLTVISSFVNLSEDIVKGYEFNARYARDLFDGRFVLNANVTKYTEQSTRLFPEEFLTDANGIVTQPDWVGSFDVTYAIDNVTFRYGIDWTDGDKNKTYEFFAFDELTGETDPDTVQAFRDQYLLETDDYFLHSASVQVDVDQFEFTFGVRNLFNTAPPEITAIGFNTVGNAPLYSGYDYRGRTWFANVNFAL